MRMFFGRFLPHFWAVFGAKSGLFWLRFDQGPGTGRLPDCPSSADGSVTGDARRFLPASMSGMAPTENPSRLHRRLWGLIDSMQVNGPDLTPHYGMAKLETVTG